MKKEYMKPNMQVIKLEATDIIAQSPVDGWANGEPTGGIEED